MDHSSYDCYLEHEVLHATPEKLISLLQRAVLDRLASAEEHVASGRIRERSHQISRAQEMINALMLSLDHNVGGDISRNLVELYAYMQTRLQEANAGQIAAPIREVRHLMTELASAWSQSQFHQESTLLDPIPQAPAALNCSY